MVAIGDLSRFDDEKRDNGADFPVEPKRNGDFWMM